MITNKGNQLDDLPKSGRLVTTITSETFARFARFGDRCKNQSLDLLHNPEEQQLRQFSQHGFLMFSRRTKKI